MEQHQVSDGRGYTSHSQDSAAELDCKERESRDGNETGNAGHGAAFH